MNSMRNLSRTMPSIRGVKSLLQSKRERNFQLHAVVSKMYQFLSHDLSQSQKLKNI